MAAVATMQTAAHTTAPHPSVLSGSFVLTHGESKVKANANKPIKYQQIK